RDGNALLLVSLCLVIFASATSSFHCRSPAVIATSSLLYSFPHIAFLPSQPNLAILSSHRHEATQKPMIKNQNIEQHENGQRASHDGEVVCGKEWRKDAAAVTTTSGGERNSEGGR
ncbi:hypothetical protein L195_g054765, partial [Trifolium pratense]